MGAEIDDFVERVRERSDICAVISKYVSLELKNGRYWASCPFHDEGTESLIVEPDKGFFYCFHCHAGGDVFKFISMKENISYFDAVKRQAEQLKIPSPLRKKDSAKSKLSVRKKNLYKINRLARNFYHEFLIKSDEAEAGRKYLESRGITRGTIEKLKLGFAPKSPDKLADFLSKQGFTAEQLTDSASLFSRQETDGKIVDKMRDQLVIPMTDVFGRVAGIGGRILNPIDESDSAKFFDIPKTVIFDESNFIFGVSSPVNFLVIVEDCGDAIFLKNAGIENVAAMSNGFFEEKNLQFLFRYAGKIIFCLKGEKVNQVEFPKLSSMFKIFGSRIFFLSIPAEKNLQKIFRDEGKEKFNDLLKNSLPIFDSLLQCFLKQNAHSTSDEKIIALKKFFKIIFSDKNSKISEGRMKKISAAFDLDVETIFDQWRKLHSPSPVEKKVEMPHKAQKQLSSSNTAYKEHIFDRLCKSILRTCWQQDDLLSFTLSMLPEENFSEVHREIIDYIKKTSAEERRPDISSAKDELSESAYFEISQILEGDENYEFDAVAIQAFDESVRMAREIFLQRSQAKMMEKLGKYVAQEGAADDFLKIPKELADIHNGIENLR